MVNSRKNIRFSNLWAKLLIILWGMQGSSHALTVLETDVSAGDLKIDIDFMYRPETFFVKNPGLLTDSKLFFMRHTCDVSLDSIYGLKKSGHSIAEIYATMRNKYVWGDTDSIASTLNSQVKLLNSFFGSHKHGFPRQIFWMRELWLELALGDVFGRQFGADHTFTVGLFPFELGRGISLGDNYASSQEFLGFYADSAVDQFAPGLKFSGIIKKNKLTYDAYFALLQNKSASLSQIGAETQKREIGRQCCPRRGFGKIDFLIAGRLKWTAFQDAILGSFTLEPYGLFNDAREQTVEFIGDSSSKLGTVGFAGEYVGPRWEFGFDYAVNLGRQAVKAWDRNQVKLINNNASVVEVNTHVVDQNGNAIPYVPKSEAQTIIEASAVTTACKPQGLNGEKIGEIDGPVGYLPAPVELFNKKNRFRDAFENAYEGFMFIADGSWWIYGKDLKLAMTVGHASGDENPNFHTEDSNYQGFISLQESYVGKRVKSVFLLGGVGKLQRPHAIPNSTQRPSAFANSVSSFTDLTLAGAALWWTPTDWQKDFSLNSNALLYWNDHKIPKFDRCTKKELRECASKFLGTELNLFLTYYMMKPLKFFFVGSVFLPGQHFKDIKGKPLNDEQVGALDGVIIDIPTIGTDPGVTLNIGLQYSF